ncbi:Phox-like protein [Cylindrobasidium torrendii FP15055 ss-10]|uniref:Endosomal/vacuolar adapter protein YPT35 n=1 Tax=Cylindrobasidium torrendii FP15055 ss-10 TaxID=1314674 RepID=A0A0D7BEA0_9AGAR|nr:Phox-like protein [Cylindrobasidium torrendii FP15055 ss-10]
MDSPGPVTPTMAHPFAHTKARLEIIPNKIDIEEESRLYDALCENDDYSFGIRREPRVSLDYNASLFSRESQSIWLADNVGESATFARDVKISGWTSVGDAGTGYVVYDCVIKTKEGTVIHAHKRYSGFESLDRALRKTLSRTQRRLVPELPPKAPLSRYRPAFLDRRRVLLQHWLSSVLLHPDIGGSKAVRLWVMEN